MPLLQITGGLGQFFKQNTTPNGATRGDLWVDTSTSPPTEKIYDGTTWNPSITLTEVISLG